MIPIGDENPTFRVPVVTIALLVLLGAVWVLVQGAGLSPTALAASVCELGLVPGQLTHQAPWGTAVPLGQGLACVVDNGSALTLWTPLTSMFLHGGWMHLLGNALFLWVFGNNVEDSMGRLRFLAFYVLCGLAAAAAQIVADPASPVPMVGASGAISGVMGAYLVLYPRVRVRMLFFVFIARIPAWLVLLWWFGLQVIAAFPSLAGAQGTVPTSVAVFAHVGGFVAGVALVKLFENRAFVARHREMLAGAY